METNLSKNWTESHFVRIMVTSMDALCVRPNKLEYITHTFLGVINAYKGLIKELLFLLKKELRSS